MELLRSLAVFAEPPSPVTDRLAPLLELPEAPVDWQYTELFVQQLVPYASIYLGDEGQIGGEARDRIAGFWRALGEVPPAEPDHLAVLLALQAELGDRAAAAAPETPARDAWQRARAALLWEHLLSWLPPWLTKVQELAPPAYAAWAGLLERALAAEANAVSLPGQLPAHLREAATLPPPALGGDPFLRAVLAPARAGFIVTRRDLAAGADRLDLGLRAGERAYMLRSLLSQDAARVLDMLADLAAAAGAAARAAPPLIADFWTQRAASSHATLRSAAAAARASD